MKKKNIDAVDILIGVCLLIVAGISALQLWSMAYVKKHGEPYSEIKEIATFDDGSYYIERTDKPRQKLDTPSLTVYIDGESRSVDKVLYKNMDDTKVLCTIEGYTYTDDGDKYDPLDLLVLTIDPNYAKTHDLLPYNKTN